ncbi:hypothetical protein GCM10010344_42320 [Streptomyces bluensis]|nr:hypothetical protein GCM10010344_42320 [Streptomyces bluensis]
MASPRGWPKKVLSEPGVPGETESFVRLGAMVVPCWWFLHTKETFSVKSAEGPRVLLQALFHHTSNQ